LLGFLRFLLLCFILWSFLGGRIFLVVGRSSRIETQGRDRAKQEQRDQRDAKVPDPHATLFERLTVMEQHNDSPVKVGSPVADSEGGGQTQPETGQTDE